MKKTKSVLFTIIATALCVSLILSVGAASTITKQLEAVYKGIKILVDGVEITPTDVNGNKVEPFIVDGTTYVPVRAVSQALGKDVTWDDATSSVVISSSRETWDTPAPVDAPPAPSKNVTVSTAQELVDAIAPDTCITLKAGLYDLSTVTASDNKYAQVKNSMAALLVMDVEGLTLKAADGAEVELVTPSRFSEVVMFSGCNGITLSGIKAGHSVTGEYECDAGVVLIDQSANITVEDCYFYGCGSIGIAFKSSVTATVTGTTITDCSLRAVDIWSSEEIEFEDCKFIENRAYGCVIMGYHSTAVFRNCEISGNKKLEWSLVEFNGDVLFDGCVFADNALIYGVDPVFNGNGISLKNCDIEKGNFGGYWTSGVTDLGGNKLS